MDKEVFILNQEQLEAYGAWLFDRHYAGKDWLGEQTLDEFMEQWHSQHPCPLPSPVKVLTEVEIKKYAYQDEKGSDSHQTGNTSWLQCLLV